MQNDRVGLGWRPELAAGIFEALDRIDVLEVIADDHIEAGRRPRGEECRSISTASGSAWRAPRR